jgi:hypothetical protein
MSGPEDDVEAGVAKVLSSDLPFFSPRQARELRRKERRDAFLNALGIIEMHGKPKRRAASKP